MMLGILVGRGLVAIGLALVTAQFYPVLSQAGLRLALIIIGYAVVFYLLRRRGREGEWFGAVEMGADLAAVSAWIWLWKSPADLFWLYLFPSGLTALQNGPLLGAIASVLSVGLYLWSAVILRGGVSSLETIQWLHSIALLGTGLLFTVASSQRTAPPDSSNPTPELLDQFAQTLEEIETSQRELRANYRELAYHYRRLQEAMRGAQDALEVFSVIGRLHEEDAYWSLVETIATRFGASGGILWLVDETGSKLRVRVATGVMARFQNQLHAPPKGRVRWLDRVAESLGDYLRTIPPEELVQAHQGVPARTEDSRPQQISVPLRSAERYYGVLSLVTADPRGFEWGVEERVQSIASHVTALVAIQEQLAHLQTRLRALQVLSELDQILFSPDPHQRLTDRILQTIQPVLKFEYATLYLTGDEGKLGRAAFWNEPKDLLDSIEFERGTGIAGWVASRHRPVLISDVPNDPRLRPLGRTEEGLGSYMAVCLAVGEKVYGALSVGHSAPGFFGEDEFEWFQLIASHIALLLERAGLLRQLEILAITDGLTGLYNYRYFQIRLQDEVKRAHRYQSPFAVLLMDLDNFKQINDHLSHMQGDYVLLQFAELLKKTLRETELVARYGGDEFVVLLPATDLKAAKIAAERLRQATAESSFLSLEGGQALHLTISIGVAAYPDSTQNAESLIELADSALDRAKRSGRNIVVAVE